MDVEIPYVVAWCAHCEFEYRLFAPMPARHWVIRHRNMCPTQHDLLGPDSLGLIYSDMAGVMPSDQHKLALPLRLKWKPAHGRLCK